MRAGCGLGHRFLHTAKRATGNPAPLSLICHGRGGAMKIIAFINDQDELPKALTQLGPPTEPPKTVNAQDHWQGNCKPLALAISTRCFN